ncbi:MAG: GT2 family glycosyltransferase [Desulforhopalus sp.]|jgi:GT2 family glycosyltransferase
MDIITLMLATCCRDELLRRELESFTKLHLPEIKLKVLVGDNAYRDETKKLCETFNFRLDITYIPHKTPGKNSTLNALLPHAEGEYYVFTDDDITADKNWIFSLIESAKKYPEATVFGGRIRPFIPKGCELPDNEMVNKFVNTGNLDESEGPISHLKIFGPNMMVRSGVFTEGVGFNVDIGPNGKSYMMGSETEFNLRLELHGYKASYVPDALVYHYIRPEQFLVEWWMERMERRGRGSLLLMDPSEMPRLFGAPRYLYLKVLKLYFGSLIAALKRDKEKSLALRSAYYFTLGQIKQFRIYGSGNSE